MRGTMERKASTIQVGHTVPELGDHEILNLPPPRMPVKVVKVYVGNPTTLNIVSECWAGDKPASWMERNQIRQIQAIGGYDHPILRFG